MSFQFISNWVFLFNCTFLDPKQNKDCIAFSKKYDLNEHLEIFFKYFTINYNQRTDKVK